MWPGRRPRAGRGLNTGGPRLKVTQALALGLLHGPAELLPISSSGHVAVVPWLMRWDYVELDDDLRKSFEVVLHAGTAAALLITLRGEVEDTIRGLDVRRLSLGALALAPPAIVGYGLEREIEARLGTPPTIATALVVGAVAMGLSDRRPQERGHEQAGAADALWLGVAQACALVPGVSRNGATLAAARLRRFARADANWLSRNVALPVIAGATALKALRLSRRGLPAGTSVPFAVGAGGAFVSTLACSWMIRQVERDRSLLPYAAYRLGVAALVAARLLRER
jgi:undecaprenyl-diphosphatase